MCVHVYVYMCFQWAHACVSYFPIALIKQCGHSNLQKKELWGLELQRDVTLSSVKVECISLAGHQSSMAANSRHVDWSSS